MERLDRFMARAARAYYAARDPFADFTTAPEISQAFGELIGAWCVDQHAALGAPDPVRLVELGPGRGTLMGDALRAIGRLGPAFAASLSVVLVETSPRLRGLLASRFPDAVLLDTLDALPEGPAIVLGNEFLDALPIREFVRRGAGWREHHVAGGALVEAETDARPPHPPTDPLEGDVVATSEAADAVVRDLAARARRGDAASLLIDYGGELDRGSTLQALGRDGPADPFACPGAVDLTAHVDFDGLARTARAAGAAVHGPLPQGLFLSRLGLYPRAARLSAALARTAPERAREPIDAANRLAQPEGMGVLFKAMALTPPGAPVPAGFGAPA